MPIDDLIRMLGEYRAKHGNLRCVTRGFDESDYDDVATVEIVYLRLNTQPGDHTAGAHIEQVEQEGGEACLSIDF